MRKIDGRNAKSGYSLQRIIHELSVGDRSLFQGPFGTFTLHRDTLHPGVFLAGGIADYAFRSMLRQATAMQGPHRIFPFYANRRPDEAAFWKSCESSSQLIPLQVDYDDDTPSGPYL